MTGRCLRLYSGSMETSPDDQPTQEIDPSLLIIEQIQMHYAEYRTAQDGIEHANHMTCIDDLLDRLLVVGYTATGAVIAPPIDTPI